MNLKFSGETNSVFVNLRFLGETCLRRRVEEAAAERCHTTSTSRASGAKQLGHCICHLFFLYLYFNPFKYLCHTLCLFL